MITDIPKTPEQFLRPPTQIERSITEGQEKYQSKKVPIEKMASYALNRIIDKSDIEDMKNETIANNLIEKYKDKGGVEIILPDSSGEIDFIGDTGFNHNIAIICAPNCFPVSVEFQKPGEINTVVYGQEFKDPKVNLDNLKLALEKYIKQGYKVVESNIVMPEEDINNSGKINRYLVSELTDVIEASSEQHIHVEVTSYSKEQINNKAGLIFSTEIDEGGHSTITRINAKEIQ